MAIPVAKWKDVAAAHNILCRHRGFVAVICYGQITLGTIRHDTTPQATTIVPIMKKHSKETHTIRNNT